MTHIHIHIGADCTNERIAEIAAMFAEQPQPEKPKGKGRFEALLIEHTGKQMRLPAGTAAEERERIAEERCNELGIIEQTETEETNEQLF